MHTSALVRRKSWSCLCQHGGAHTLWFNTRITLYCRDFHMWLVLPIFCSAMYRAMITPNTPESGFLLGFTNLWVVLTPAYSIAVLVSFYDKSSYFQKIRWLSKQIFYISYKSIKFEQLAVLSYLSRMSNFFFATLNLWIVSSKAELVAWQMHGDFLLVSASFSFSPGSYPQGTGLING